VNFVISNFFYVLSSPMLLVFQNAAFFLHCLMRPMDGNPGHLPPPSPTRPQCRCQAMFYLARDMLPLKSLSRQFIHACILVLLLQSLSCDCLFTVLSQPRRQHQPVMYTPTSAPLSVRPKHKGRRLSLDKRGGSTTPFTTGLSLPTITEQIRALATFEMLTPPPPTYAPRRKSLPWLIALAPCLPSARDMTRRGARATSEHSLHSRSRARYQHNPSPSTMTSQYEIFRQPSGFKNLQDAQLPLCPHYANPGRTDYECRMRPRSHRHNGESIVYLQVPPAHHECSFIGSSHRLSSLSTTDGYPLAVIRPRERRLRFPDTSQRKAQDQDNVGAMLHTPRPVTRHPPLKCLRSKTLKGSELRFQPSAKAQTLGKPLQRQNALSLIPVTSMASPTAIMPHVVNNLGRNGDDDLTPPPYNSWQDPRGGRSVLGSRLVCTPVERYTAEEARLNLVGGRSPSSLRPFNTDELLFCFS
jgi:hypothetical protein